MRASTATRPARRLIAGLSPIPLAVALAAAPAIARTEIGSTAPPVVGTSLAGRPVRPSLDGRVTVVNFWATWCPPCRAETPDLIAAYAALHARGVAFLGVDTTETAPIVQTFLSAKGVPYPTVLASPAVYNGYGIAFIPTTFVVDANGIVRARWTGGITPEQLAHYVADARAGRSSTYVSPVQARIDESLAPQRFRFGGDATERSAAIAAMNAAVARTDALVARNASGIDFIRTLSDEGTLLVAAGRAELAAATTVARKIAGEQLLARGDGDLDDPRGAVRADRAALALSPHAPKLVEAVAMAYYRAHAYDAMIPYATRYTRLVPDDGDGWSTLGLAYQRARRYAAAAAAYERSLAELQAAARRTPSQDALADVADTALDTADVYVSLGDAARARSTFAIANAYGDRLAVAGPYARLERNVKERTQEGLVAVALARHAEKAVVSVVPWTGPDLPGSVASTLKYRLIVAAPAGRTITLAAEGLPRHWVGSFCADGLCSPQTVSFATPASGVKTYEFQLVPPTDGARPGAVRIAVAGGTSVPVPPIPLAK